MTTITKKLLLISTFVAITSVPTSAQTVYLQCNWGGASGNVRVDFDHSIVTESSLYTKHTARYRAVISREYIEWQVENGTLRIDRLSGRTIHIRSDGLAGSRPWEGRCTNAQPAIP
jgi:hypothetical protein